MNLKRIKNDAFEETDAFASGCLVHLHIRCWGASSKMSDDMLSTFLAENKKEAKDKMRAMYDLMPDKTKLKAIQVMRGQAKRFIFAYALPFPIDGLAFVPKTAIELIDENLKKRKVDYFEAVDDFLSVYDQQVKDYAENNPDLYVSTKYPPVHILRHRFVFDWSYRAFGVPENNGILTPEIYKSEMKKFKAEIEEMKVMAVSAVGKEFLNRIDSLREQCLGGQINSATVDSLNAFLNKFDEHWDGFFAHKQLKEMIKEVKSYMDGTDAHVLRADTSFRLMIGHKMSSVADDFKKVGSQNVRLKRSIDI